jgi:hypothetical protein
MRTFVTARHFGVAGAPRRAGRELAIWSGHIRRRQGTLLIRRTGIRLEVLCALGKRNSRGGSSEVCSRIPDD